MSVQQNQAVGEKTVAAAPEDPTQAAALDNDICLLVDEDDNLVGTASKRDCHRVDKEGKVLLHRAFSVFLFNSRGEMLMQRRSFSKVTYAGYYSNAVCSHPLYINGKEEDVISAARRRLNQELGIPLNELDPKLFKFLTRVHYHDIGDGVWGEHEVDHILFFQGDVTVDPNPDEISEICYVPKNDFDEHLLALKGPMTPWFNLIRKEKLKEWWDNLQNLNKIAEPEKIHRMTDTSK